MHIFIGFDNGWQWQVNRAGIVTYFTTFGAAYKWHISHIGSKSPERLQQIFTKEKSL